MVTLKIFSQSNNIHALLYLQRFLGNARLKFTKYQAKARQHSEAEPSLFGGYSISSSTLSSKNNRSYF